MDKSVRFGLPGTYISIDGELPQFFIPKVIPLELVIFLSHRKKHQVQGRQFGASRLFITGPPKSALTFWAGQENNQCHGMVILARWAPLIMSK